MSECVNCKHLSGSGLCDITGLASGECPLLQHTAEKRPCINCQYLKPDGDDYKCNHESVIAYPNGAECENSDENDSCADCPYIMLNGKNPTCSHNLIADPHDETCEHWVCGEEGRNDRIQEWEIGDKVKAGVIDGIVIEVHFSPERYYLETSNGEKITFFPHVGNRSGWVDAP